MINQQLIRAWYTPVEVITLRSWLVVATIVNVLLLTFDFLRGDEQLLLIGFVGCAALAALRASLPQPNQIQQRNIALMICIAIISLGIYRLILMPISLFNIWMGAWMILPGLYPYSGYQTEQYRCGQQRTLNISDRVWIKA